MHELNNSRVRISTLEQSLAKVEQVRTELVVSELRVAALLQERERLGKSL